jgi:large subunit ribosomal protein L10
MARPEKEAAVAQLTKEFEGAAGIYLADFTGLTVEAVEQLRSQLYSEGVSYRVVKNTLAKRAAGATKCGDLSPYFKGPTAVAISATDPVAPARVLAKFIKQHEKPALKAGFVDGRLLQAQEVQGVAALPSREVLLAQFLGALQSPMSKVLFALNGVGGNLVRALAEIQKKKEGAEGGQ